MLIYRPPEKLVGFFSYLVRGMGWLLSVVGVALFIGGVWLLSHPDSKVNFNGVETTDTGPKLFFVLFPLPFIALGLFLALRGPVVLRRFMSLLGDKRE